MIQHTHASTEGFLTSYARRGGPPTTFLIEAQVLGSIMGGILDMAEAAAILHPEHFEDPAHGLIFAAMNDQPEGARDLASLRRHFDQTGGQDDAGGPAYLTQLLGQAACNADADLAVDMRAIHAAWKHREVRREAIRHGVG